MRLREEPGTTSPPSMRAPSHPPLRRSPRSPASMARSRNTPRAPWRFSPSSMSSARPPPWLPPVAGAASWLASAWDQNGGLVVSSPINARLEEVALDWVKGLFHLPADSAGGFVTSATAANFCALAAARHALLERAGWDVEAQGLFGAPPITVVVGEEVHASVQKALSMAGFGRERVVRVPCDVQGRMRLEEFPAVTERTIVCVQAGNVNTGAFDPVAGICRRAREQGAWVHVDGAFGLWAAAAPARAHL